MSEKKNGKAFDKKEPTGAVIRWSKIKWALVIYDIVIFAASALLLFVLYDGQSGLSATGVALQCLISALSIFLMRFVLDIYSQIWRYGGIQSYIRLLAADGVACAIYLLLERVLPIEHISFVRLVAFCCINLLGALAIRMFYRYAYKCANRDTFISRAVVFAVRMLTGRIFEPNAEYDLKQNKIKIAIVGAGRVGVGLAEELFNNPAASYVPVCFIEKNKNKVGRQIHGISVLGESEARFDDLKERGVQEIVFAIPTMSAEDKKRLYEYYKKSGCKIKNYDFPTIQTAGNQKRTLREFDIEELLFRKAVSLPGDQTAAYYKDKVILITGGGGSIGSELCRQIAAMKPRKLIVLDVYENGAYDIQQELMIAYGADIDICVEILSVCNKPALERVFAQYRPNIVLHAAAHKHVPLMEHNCCEAVDNNVFGTYNTVSLANEYGAERFIMVSTDKAVNPTNVMGATKRMCEMIVQSFSQIGSSCVFSATRFGNVLGSAGSVIPLFKRQIASGGPVTLTDKRIIRYFMTIPEASQLVLQSGAMAKNGQLFVLDMGKPVKILELAENMIRLSGFEPYRDIDIREIGLRPGEKLYEELLIKSETLEKTDNSMIFIETDAPLPYEVIKEKLALLDAAVKSGDDELVKQTLHKVVPTFMTPEEVNAKAQMSDEMKEVEGAERANSLV